MFHGGNTVNGSRESALPSSHFTVKWEINASLLGNDAGANGAVNVYPTQSSPVAYDGYLYVPESATSNVWKINASTGQLAGYYNVQGTAGTITNTIQSTPLVTTDAAGTPFLILSTNHNNQYFVSINLTSGKISTCAPGKNFVGSPTAVAPGSFLVGAYNGANLYNVTANGLAGCGTNNWGGPAGAARYFSTASVGFLPSAPPSTTVTTYYFLIDQATNEIDAYDAATATQPWSSVALGTADGSLALTNVSWGTHIGNVQAPLGFFANYKAGGGVSQILAIDVNCGKAAAGQCGATSPVSDTLGTYSIDNTAANSGVDSTVALEHLSANQTQVIYGTANGNLSGVTATLQSSATAVFPTSMSGYAINWSNSWNYSTGSPFQASPVVAGNQAMDGNLNGDFYILNSSSGSLLWNHTFSGSFYSSPVIYNKSIYVLTSTGQLADIAPASPAVTMTVPATVPAGTNAPVNVTVTGVTTNGSAGAPVGNSPVSLYFRGGNYSTWTLAAPNTTTNATTGVASFLWRAPSANVQVQYDFVSKASPPGYLPGKAFGSTLVPASAVSTALSVSVVVNQSVISPGGTTGVGFKVTNSTGSLVANATVTLVDPAAAWWAPSGPLSTGSSGWAWADLTAPATLTNTTSVLIGAQASMVGYTGASGYGTVTVSPVVPPGTPSLGANVTPSSVSLMVGKSTTLEVRVFNASSTSNSPVSGATVSVTPVSSSLGAFNHSTESSVGGIAYFSFTAGSANGTFLATFNASANGYVHAQTAMAISVSPLVTPPTASSPLLVLTATAASTALPGAAVPIALHGTLENTTTGATMSNAAGALVTVRFIGSPSGSALSSLEVSLNGSGENSSLVLTTGVSSSEYLVELGYNVSLAGAISGQASSTVAVVPPPLVVTAQVSASLSFGQSSSLTVSVSTAAGTPLAGATVDVATSSSSAVTLKNSTGSTGSNGVATFAFTVTSQSPVSSLDLVFHVSASKNGYAPAYNSTQAYVSSSSSSSSGTNSTGGYLGLSILSWVLLVLVIILLVALIAALARRGSDSGPRPEARPGAGGAPADSGAGAAGSAGATAGAVAEVPAPDWKEDEPTDASDAPETASASEEPQTTPTETATESPGEPADSPDAEASANPPEETESGSQEAEESEPTDDNEAESEPSSSKESEEPPEE